MHPRMKRNIIVIIIRDEHVRRNKVHALTNEWSMMGEKFTRMCMSVWDERGKTKIKSKNWRSHDRAQRGWMSVIMHACV